MPTRLWMRLICTCLIAAVSAMAQSTRGTILGHVVDATGATVPRTKITIENQNTGLKSDVTSSDDGEYTAPNLDPGVYQISITAEGFKTRVVRDVLVAVNQTVRIDPRLEVGEVTTRVAVESSAPVIQTDSSSLGNVVDGKQIVSMPLNGRNNLNSLLALAPGVQSTGTNPYIPEGTTGLVS